MTYRNCQVLKVKKKCLYFRHVHTYQVGKETYNQDLFHLLRVP